jgi:hypothetical protein
MKKLIFMTVIMVFGLALFSGCASTTGRTAGEHVDDATITAKVNDIIVKDDDAKYLKIDVLADGNVTLGVHKQEGRGPDSKRSGRSRVNSVKRT